MSYLLNLSTKGEDGIKNPQKSVNVVYGCPLSKEGGINEQGGYMPNFISSFKLLQRDFNVILLSYIFKIEDKIFTTQAAFAGVLKPAEKGLL